jgi:uncharacterized protein involved in cysteine biosynthesis
MDHLVRGIRLVFAERRLRRYVWRPMLLAAAIFLAITVLAYLWVTPIVQGWIASVGLGGQMSAILGTVAFVLFWWFISSMLFVAIAGLLSSFLWERLSHEVEAMEGLLPHHEVKLGCGAAVYDTTIRGVLSLFVAVAALLLGWACFGIVGLLLTGWLGLMDYTSCSFARRGILVDRQFAAVYRLEGWRSFLIGAGFVSFFPILNVLLLPGMVAGGTLLCAKSLARSR